MSSCDPVTINTVRVAGNRVRAARSVWAGRTLHLMLMTLRGSLAKVPIPGEIVESTTALENRS